MKKKTSPGKGKGRIYDDGDKNSGSEPRVDPQKDSCGICGSLFVNCNGHMLEIPGMQVGRQRD